MPVKIQANMHDINALRGFVREASTLTRRDSRSVVRATAKQWAHLALRYTPLAPTHTEWARVNGEDVHLPSPRYRRNGGMPSLRPIPHRGYAKGGWLPAIRALGGVPAAVTSGEDGGYADRTSDAQRPAFSLWSSVPFIASLDQGGAVPHLPGRSVDLVQPSHISARATHGAARMLESQLNRYVQRMVRAWGRRRIV